MPETQRTNSLSGASAAQTIVRNAATRSTIDNVTTLISSVGGRTRATLSFRVGFADEPLHHRGITHLVGHLASAAADQDESTCHVSVSASTLSFHFSGGALAVANEIGAVCHWIGSARAHADERALERVRGAAKADQRLHAPEHTRVLRARFGLPGWGGGSVPELGLDSIGVDDIHDWVTTYLTSGNSVLALSGTKATTLRVPLPDGNYVPVTPPQPTLLNPPALIASPTPMLSLSGLLTTDENHLDRDRAVAGLSTEIVRSRIAFALQQRYGSELKIRGGPMTLGPHSVHSVVWADVDAEIEAKVADIAAEALAVLVANGLLEGELGAHVKRRLSAYERAAGTGSGAHDLLHRQALGALNEQPWSLALERRMLSGASSELVGAQLSQFSDSAVLMMAETDPPVRAWSAGATLAPFDADGEILRSRPAYGLSSRHQPCRLIVGEDGITLRSLTAADDQVRWADVAMAQSWDDGRLLLTSTAAGEFDIAPERWLAPDAVTQAVHRHLGDQPIIEMGPRETPPSAPLRLSDRIAPMWWWGAVLVGVLLIAVGSAPLLPGQLTWLRWLLGAVGLVTFVIGGAWAYDTALTERRLQTGRVTGNSLPH
ncbi:hypothetical protein [Cumulibacter soli]|uniref:hypothetical protein n=1 Tax=Cumulibacter soli TaxID=2546344 RepID=UPI0010685DD6|nr:hypothetical protein [Cumulibacter soli]